LVARKLLQNKLKDVELSIRGILRGFGVEVGQVTRKKFKVSIPVSANSWPAKRRSSALPKPCRTQGGIAHPV
jgi:hypothetical protein